MRLAKKVAIVTGGGSGIGAAICQAFANEGASVVVADIHAEGSDAVASEINAHGGVAMAMVTDVAEPSSVSQMAASTLSAYGQIDVLVNNAGVRLIKGFMQHTSSDWQRMIDINLTGPFLCAQAVIPAMLRAGGGAIVNLCSIASFMGRPNRCGYVAAKSGLLGLTRAMAVDMTGTGIRVNAIAPGMIASPFNQSFAEAEETKDTWAQENVIGRWGRPEDIAGAAVYLACDESGFVTGTEIKIDGGWLNTRARAGEVPMWD